MIVDDEALAQDLIESHLGKFPDIQVVGKCHTAMEAIKLLNQHDIDLLFLDIEMPDLTGIEMLKAIKQPPLTVLTTAYSEYAVESYELNVVDYLLKPVRFNRFFKAMDKVMPLLNKQRHEVEAPVKASKEDFIFVKSEYKAIKIEFNKIIYIEGMQKHVRFHLTDKKVMSLMSLRALEDILPPTQFFRCQKSFIVNLKKIESIDGNLLYLNSGDKIPMSKNVRQELLNLIDKNRLL